MSHYANASFCDHIVYRLGKKYPLRFTWISLFFIYVLQYPLGRFLLASSAEVQYSWEDWLIAYGFVIISALVFMAFLYVGMCGRPINIYPVIQPQWKRRRTIGLTMALLLFCLFFFWSYLMLNLKIGMTIYFDFDPLPFKVTGLLFYGRLFLQPLILAYIALGYSSSRLKWLVFLIMAALGAWVSLTSGSRFAGILFALPMLLLFNGKSKYIAFAVIVLAYITIATLSRNFYLPFQIGGEYIQRYANLEYQSAVTENIFLLPLSYAVDRTMGMSEVLMTLNFGAITPNLMDSLASFFSYFLPFISGGNSVSIKNVYGLDDDAFGGYGLDMFSNYWVYFGGNSFLYGCGLALIGWMLGKTYRLFANGLRRLGIKEGFLLIFILLFLLIMDGRAFLFPLLLLVAWLFSRKSTSHILYSMLKFFSKKHTIVSCRAQPGFAAYSLT